MSNESSRPRAERRGDEDAGVGSILDRLAKRRVRVMHMAGTLALVTVVVHTSLRIARNLPFDPVAVPGGLYGVSTLVTPIVLGLALVVVGLAATRATSRVGLLFAGVFTVIAVFDSAATLPAIVAVAGGGTMALAGVVGRPKTVKRYRLAAVAALLACGTGVSLASTAGLVDPTLQELGGLLTLLGIAGIGVSAERDWVALAIGLVVVAFVVFASMTRPFVVGSAMLVGFAIVDVPQVVVAVAIGGAVVATVSGLRLRTPGLAIGGTLLVMAGVPATLPRASAVILGAILALGGLERSLTVESDGPEGGMSS